MGMDGVTFSSKTGGRPRQEDCELKASLGYIVRPFLETNKVINWLINLTVIKNEGLERWLSG